MFLSSPLDSTPLHGLLHKAYFNGFGWFVKKQWSRWKRGKSIGLTRNLRWFWISFAQGSPQIYCFADLNTVAMSVQSMRQTLHHQIRKHPTALPVTSSSLQRSCL